MITIKDLTKTYKSKNRRICTALDKISLTFPDSGMIFIIGKSGSGKSTLLNMIGGLDGFDSGTIVADGNDLSNFKDGDFYKYRASYVGFIFQDYHLIDELTVEENITLEAEIANASSIDVETSLISVDLAGYGQRYPDELSGGQQQRVAIARALVKSPKVILCDEPTGNLDNNTSTQIMDLLKEISKDRLVLIVSHNMPDAEKYADRIIELSDGRVVNDCTRRTGYSNELTIQDGILTLPYNHNLTNEETEKISEDIGNGKIKAVFQNDGGYETTKELSEQKETVPLKSSRMRTGTVAKLFASFTRNVKIRMAITAFISAVMVVLLIIIQSFLMFDSSTAIMQSIGTEKAGNIVLKKDKYADEYGNVDRAKLYKVTDSDLQKINELNGTPTKNYLLYNYAIPVNLKNRPTSVESENAFSFNFGSRNIFSPQMPGTLACDLAYLTKHFGKNGELTVLSGNVNDSLSGAGVIITDYLADAMLMFNPTKFHSYDDLIGSIYDESSHKWGDIVAVIDTDYKERYADIIKMVAENPDIDSSGLNALDKEIVIDLLDDIKTNLSIGYSINPNFYSEAVKEESKNYARMIKATLTCEGIGSTVLETGTVVSENYDETNLNDGEILLTVSVLKEFFPDITDNQFPFPQTLTIEQYEYPNNTGELVYRKTFTVVGKAKYITLSENDFKEYKEIDIIPYSVYIDTPENPGEIIDGMESSFYSWNSMESTAITLLNKSVAMFFDLFRLIEVMILTMTVVFIISHSIRSVKNNYYQIGVIKAIGGRNSDILKIFVAQTLMLSIGISALIYLGSAVFIDVANNILIASFTAITKTGVGDISIISFNLAPVLLAMGATMILGLLSTAVPLIMLNKIKPINIIKAKE